MSDKQINAIDNRLKLAIKDLDLLLVSKDPQTLQQSSLAFVKIDKARAELLRLRSKPHAIY